MTRALRTMLITTGVGLALVGTVAVGAGAFQLGVAIGDSLTTALSSGNATEQRDAPRTEQDADFGTVVVYDVDANGELDPVAVGTAGEVWNLFTRIVGADEAGSSILHFKTGDAPESDTLAYVFQDRDPQYWTLVVNLDTADDPTLLIATLVHEYAHVFSYDPSEFDAKAASCETFQVIEGCAENHSYLWAFYEEFWAGYSEHPDLENIDEDIAGQFFEQHESDFVSEYAATNIGEDFAESFMTFVLEESWSAETVAGQKLDFFSDYPELVELRAHVREELGAELGLR